MSYYYKVIISLIGSLCFLLVLPLLAGINGERELQETALTPVVFLPGTGNILYVDKSVDQTAGGYTGSGDSWANAIAELADALKWANENKAQFTSSALLKIYVAKGTYKPMYTPEDGKGFSADAQYARDRTFLMVRNVELYGGFDPTNGKTALTDRILPGKNGTNADGTILSGDLNGNDATGIPVTDLKDHATRQDNAYHVVLTVSKTEAVGVVLDGFGIKGGNANDDSSPITVNGQPVSAYNGGGIFSFSFLSSSSVMLRNSSIYNNSCNNGDSEGGGVFSSSSFSSSSVTLRNSSIYNNSSDYGGGIFSFSFLSSSSVTLRNSSVYNNSSDYSGGIFSYSSSSNGVKLYNSILAGNIGPSYVYFQGGKKEVTVYNSLVYGNVKSAIDNSNSTLSTNVGSISKDIQYSLVQNIDAGSSNVSGDTRNNNLDGTIAYSNLFVDAAGGDYSLADNSPAIDAGSNALYEGNLANDLDLAGNPRLSGCNIDIGAYENQSNQGTLCFIPNADNILYVNQSVDQTAAGYTGSGNSWDNAIPELADALKWANDNKAINLWDVNNPLKIYVAKGTYLPKYSPEDGVADSANPTDNRDKSFLMVENVQLYGGFDPLNNIITLDDARVMPEVLADGIPKESSTILSGDIGMTAEKGDNAYHVVVSSGDVGKALVDGFLIHGGNATGGQSSIRINSNYIKRWNGGGIHLYNSCPVLRNLVISQNHADKHAGAIAMEAIQNYSFLYNILICHNTAEYGAAIVFLGAEGKGNFSNLTMYHNQSISSSSLFGFFGSTFLLSNSIVVDDEWSKISVSELKNTLLVGDDDFESIVWTDGGGNIITAESPFRNEQEGDFKLKESSQAQDAGNAQVYWNLLHDAAPSTNPLLMPEAENESWGRDLAGERRFRGEAIDMGAYEYQCEQVNYDNVVFEDAAVTYNGIANTILATDLPQGVTAVYEIKDAAGAVVTEAVNVGTYTVTATLSGCGLDKELTATLKIEAVTLTVTANSGQGKVYGEADPAFTYTVSGYQGTDHDSILSGALSRTVGEDVGAYPIGQGNLNAGSNYNIDFTSADFKIMKAVLPAFTFADASFVYDGTARSLKASGLPAGTTMSYIGNDRTEAGEYTVIAIIDGGNNYISTRETAKLTIKKAKQVISFSAPEKLGRDAGTVSLDVHSDAGLPINLSVDDPSIATVSGTELRVHRLGTFQITATQLGDANHEAAAAVTVTVRVVAGAGAKLPIVLHKALSPNGDGINDFLTIEGIQDYPENKVTIFDKSGAVLAEIIGYNNRDNVFTGKESRDGTYFYYLDLKDNGVWKREKGYFVIRR